MVDLYCASFLHRFAAIESAEMAHSVPRSRGDGRLLNIAHRVCGRPHHGAKRRGELALALQALAGLECLYRPWVGLDEGLVDGVRLVTAAQDLVGAPELKEARHIAGLSAPTGLQRI